MQAINYRVFAFMRLLSPLHIAAAGAASLKLENMTALSGKIDGAIPMTATQKLSVMHGGRTVDVAVIPANNIMGRMRRHVASLVLSALEQKGERVKLETYSSLTCGAFTGNPDGRDPLFAEYREARAHPYIGLLGGGPRMMRRYVRCYNAVPYMEETTSMFELVKHPHLDDLSMNWGSGTEGGGGRLYPDRLLQRWILNRNDDLHALVNMGQAAATIEDFEQRIVEYQESILRSKPKGDQEKEDGGRTSSNRASTRAFTAFEFVVPGVVFPLTFEFAVNEAQLGLFLAALDSFAATERMGGHARNGMGRFALDDVVVEDCVKGELIDGVFNESRLVEGSDAQGWIDSWKVEAAGLNAADLDRLFAPPSDVSEKEKKAKKAGAKA